MKALVIGCGRVGSTIALQLHHGGAGTSPSSTRTRTRSRVSATTGPARFIVGHGMDTDLLREAGIEEADAVVVATDGDNTNIVIGQVAQKRFGIDCVVVRILDPARADFYAARGLRTVCPTKTAIDTLIEAVRACEIPGAKVPA